MKKSGRQARHVFPTLRLAAVFAAGSVWFFAVPWAGEMMIFLGAGYVALVVSLALLDYIWLGDSRGGAVTRSMETVLSLGEPNAIFIEVTHLGRKPARIVVRDEPPLEFRSESAVITFDLGPEQRARANYKVEPLERGDYVFGNINARYFTRLGLVARQETLEQSTSVKVYPDVFQTKKHLILSREHRVTMMGLRRSRLLGQGQEFERLRDYVPDDPLRHVDWKATARRGSLITREYDVEQSQHVMILLDLGRTMASKTRDVDGKLGMSKADYAINASVLLAHVAAGSDDRIGLFCFAQSPIVFVPPAKGASQATALMDALYSLRPRVEESDYFQNLALLGHRQRKRSLVFLFTDLIDTESSRSLIRSVSLLAPKHLLVCVALADYELPSITGSMPGKPADMYVQTVAAGIIQERKNALAQLAALGAVTIDATPADLSISAVNKYLQLKREARV